MKARQENLKSVDILGNGKCSSDREILTAVLKRWRKRLGYFSVFAAAPALLVSQVQEAHSDEVKRPEASVAGLGARGLLKMLATNTSDRELLKRQSEFRLPGYKGNFAMVTPPMAGNDDCPGRIIPGGAYTAAVPYVDSGNTIGANNTVTLARSIFYCYYAYNAAGPDHVYSFTLTGRGASPQIQVSTTSSSYRPVVYVLQGGPSGSCPVGTGSSPCGMLVYSDAVTSGGTATLDSNQMNFLPLNVPLHLFVDSPFSGPTDAGPYTLRMQDVTVSSSTCSNPIDCPEFFVYQHYIDFLSRQPDAAGIEAWKAVLGNCLPGDTSCDRIQVSSSFFRSPEFQGRGYFLYRFYPVAFGRKPDYDEFVQDFWRVSGFLSDAELETQKLGFISEFMSRSAFMTKFDGLNNTQYVDTLLSTAGITHPARDFWIAALGNGTRTRAQVLREISETTQVYNKYYNQAFVVMQYFGYLRRQPDAQYLVWIAHLDSTGDYRSMINGFINSLEYRARFGP